MAKTETILSKDASGTFSIEKVARADIARIDIADVDLVVTTKSGERYILPKAGIDAMSDHPPTVALSDTKISVDQLMSEVGTVVQLDTNDTDITTQNLSELEKQIHKKDEDAKKLKEKIEEIEKQLETKQAELDKKVEEENKHKADHEKDSNADSLTTNTETSVEKLVQEAKKIDENLHRSDKEYSDPVHYQPPPTPAASPPGVPAPISLTPFVSISMGNVVGTTVAGSNIYGGGGASGSDAASYIGPRDPLQFSAATITGTSGSDTIYANGPLVGNANPSADRSNNAKEILLNVAGYFTKLNDVVVSGVPASVSIVGGTDNGDGTWTIPATSVINNSTFTLIYNMDAWRTSGSNTFDLSFTVSGSASRGANFETTQSFRFMYLDVTDVSQVTNPVLVYDSKGQAKQIYVLPTLAQPAIINSGDGDDIVYGGLNNDTITVGNGNDQIYAGAGDDTVLTGNGNNAISMGEGNNVLTSGTGNDTITAGDGNNTIQAGNGTNSLTLGNGTNVVTGGINNDTLITGNGNNTINLGDGTNSVTAGNGVNIITTGSGDDTITTGTGAATINAGGGINIITTGGGLVSITTLAGNDTITVNGGGGTISAGDGTNIIQVTTGNYTITTGAGNDTVTAGNGNNIINVGDGTNNVTSGNGNNTFTAGNGNDTITAGNGNNIFKSGLGTNSYTAGTGINSVDYSLVTTTAVVITLAAGTATGTGLDDTFTNLLNATGTNLDDTISGTTGNNIIRAGAGNDVITGNGGNDTIYGEDGNDTITGGTGNDTIYAGNGDNIVYAGTSGTDFVYGGTGNNTFISEHAGVRYDGTNGTDILSGVYNTIDYSAATTNMTINLAGGFGQGSLAQGDFYAFTQTTGFSSINKIIGGAANDVITGSNANDWLIGGAGDDTLRGGAGTNILDGGTGVNTYYTGTGNDQIFARGSYEIVRYTESGAGVVVNIDNIAHSFTNSSGVTVNIAADSGGNKGVTAADAQSYSNGDTYAIISGSSANISELYGSHYGDFIFGGSSGTRFYTGNGNDYILGGTGAELFALSPGADRFNAGAGTDVVYTANNLYSDVASTVYLDATFDLNGNGVADYIDKGVGSLSQGGTTYTGFGQGRATTLLVNFENILGGSLNDTLIGDGGNNVINGRAGSNIMYGLGGNDTIHSAFGSNTIDGGAGTDTVDFSNSYFPPTNLVVQQAYVFLADASFNGASDKAFYWAGTANSGYQARTGTSVYSTIVNVENITGSALDDVLYGNASANTIRAGNGNDVIAGNGGADSLFGEGGNDTFYATAAQVPTTTLFDGGAGTDTVQASGLAVTATSISNARYNSIEVLDVRNNASGNAYSMNANDITGLADNGASSSITLKIDSGDTFTISTGAGTGALSSSIFSSNATDTIYYLYSDAGQTNRVAIIDVHIGA